MIKLNVRLLALGVSLTLLASAGAVVADQKIKTKSNIKNDRAIEGGASSTAVSESSSAANSSASSAKKIDLAK